MVLSSGEMKSNCYFIGSLKGMTAVTTARKSIVNI
jgi:hypothetical protein